MSLDTGERGLRKEQWRERKRKRRRIVSPRFFAFLATPRSHYLKALNRLRDQVILRLPVVANPRVGTTSKFLCHYGILKLNYAAVKLNHVDQSKLNNVAVVVRRSIPDTHVITR